MSMDAQFYGIGVGPGDPELMTLKAARLIESADVISYLVNEAGDSQSLGIVQACSSSLLAKAHIHYPIHMPMSRDPNVGAAVYNQAALDIEDFLREGKRVVFLCEGDPLFFGSFAYLLERLKEAWDCDVVPGITSPQTASSVLQIPLTILKESYAVISGRHTDEQIRQALLLHDTVVIMKAGMARPRLLKLLKQTDRFHHGQYLEYISRKNQKVVVDLNHLDPELSGPYFSLFVIAKPSSQRRRQVS